MKKYSTFFLVSICLTYIIAVVVRNYDLKNGNLKEDYVTKNEVAINAENKKEAGFTVIVKDKKGSLYLSPRQIMPYMMAAAWNNISNEAAKLNIEQRIELQKAIAIICRTNLVKYWENSNRPLQLVFPTDRFPVYGLFSNKKMDELLQAVDETVGLILVFDNKTIEAPYFYLSAGNTRYTSYPYLAKKSCDEDLLCEDSANRITYTKEEFWKKMDEIVNKQESKAIELEEQPIESMIINYDNSNYVINMDVNAKNDNTVIKIPSNIIIDYFDLPSSCFTLESSENDSKISFFCTGIGDGYGLSLNYARYLASQNKDYTDILTYFYTGTTLMRRW